MPKDNKDTEPKKEPKQETGKDKKEDVSAEDNIITADEMEALESKENKMKDGLIGKIFKKKKEDNKEQKQDSSDEDDDLFPAKTEIKLIKKDLKEISSKVNTISIDTEKLDGKLESGRAQEAGLQERISHLTEEIGEIRSMVLDRERSFNEIESGYKKIQVLADDIQPALIKKEFEKKEREVVELTVKVEQVEAISQETNKQIKLFREQMDKIRSLDNLLRVSKEIEGDIEKIKDTERYTGRMAAKTEEMFSELDKRITQFAAQSEKVNSLDEISKDLMQSVDKNEVKLKEAVFKEDLEKLKATVNQTISENVRKELEPITKETGQMKESINKLKDKDELISLAKILRHPKTAEIDTKSDLPGLEDIIFKKNQEFMKTIADQDKRINELSGIIKMISTRLNNTHAPVNDVNKPLEQPITKDDINEITMRLKTLEERQKSIESRPLTDNGQIRDLYSVTETLKREIGNISTQVNIATASTEDKNYASQVELKSIKDENACLKKEVGKLSESNENLTSHINQYEQRLQFQENKPDLKEYISNLYTTTKSLEKRIDNISNSISSLEEQGSSSCSHNSDIRTVIEENKKIRNELSRLKDTIAGMTDYQAQTGNAIISLREALSNEEKSIRNISDKIVPLQPTQNMKITAKNIKKKFIDIELERSFEKIEHLSPIDSPYGNSTGIVNSETIIYDHDLRLNKLIRLIEKTEYLIDNGKPGEAKSTYNELISAYRNLNSKIPESQMTEIGPKIEKLGTRIH